LLFCRFTATGVQQVSGILRIAVISLGPIVFNMVILLVLFLISLFLGPMLNNCCAKFGATMAAVAHGLSVVGLVAFFELLWFLEVWNVSHAILGVVATCFIQRFFYKFFIALFLSREFKHDEINRAWWTGVWYNRGLGSHVLSQPAREFVVKLVEMGLFATDFIICHILLIILSVPFLIPFFDRFHSVLLCQSPSPSCRDI
jgi:1,3-beta-glucan synthase